MKINIQRLDKSIDLPVFAHEGDAAMDLRSSEDKILKAGQQSVIKTGIKVSIPEGCVGIIKDRSGLAAKNSLHCLAGVIDSGYRGEIGIVIRNLGNEDFHIEKNMRVAQLLILRHEVPSLEEVDSLEESSRSEKGFGSTGVH